MKLIDRQITNRDIERASPSLKLFCTIASPNTHIYRCWGNKSNKAMTIYIFVKWQKSRYILVHFPTKANKTVIWFVDRWSISILIDADYDLKSSCECCRCVYENLIEFCSLTKSIKRFLICCGHLATYRL